MFFLFPAACRAVCGLWRDIEIKAVNCYDRDGKKPNSDMNEYGGYSLEKLIIRGRRLVRQVKVGSAKNAVLPIIAAAMLPVTPSTLPDIPRTWKMSSRFVRCWNIWALRRGTGRKYLAVRCGAVGDI